jgi:hypothetical protein
MNQCCLLFKIRGSNAHEVRTRFEAFRNAAERLWPDTRITHHEAVGGRDVLVWVPGCCEEDAVVALYLFAGEHGRPANKGP